MSASVPRRHVALPAAAGCALLVLAAAALVIAVGPERALFSHLVEATVAGLAWLVLAVICAVRGRRSTVAYVIAFAWSISAAAGGVALVTGPPSSIGAAWVSVWTWAIGVGLAYTLGLLTATRWHSPAALRWAAVASTLVMATGFATLPTVTVEDGVAYPNALAVPGSEVLGTAGVLATTGIAFASLATLALQATSPARRRFAVPVFVAAMAGIVAIGAGALANEWAPLVQALTVPLLPCAIAATVLGSTRQRLRSVNAQLDGAADPVSALRATLTELSRDLGLAGIAIEVDGEEVVAVGRPGAEIVSLVHLGRREGILRVPPLDDDALAEIEGVAASVAAVLASVRLVNEVRRSRAELAAAREEERRRVRRDLHDEVGPLLSAVVMHADAAALASDRSPERSRRSLDKVRAAGGDAVVALRRVVRDLHPVAVDDLGLARALEEIAFRLSGPAAVSVSCSALPTLSAAVEVALYRIAAEATGNAVRHAAASDIRLAVCAAGSRVVLTVRDDGIGFDPDGSSTGVGLASMRSRAAELGGTLSIRSSSTAGTSVRAEMPLQVQA